MRNGLGLRQVYRVTKENDFSKVTVTAAAKNGALTDVKIASEGEEGKDLLTDEIRNEWAKAILESGSAAPDAVTGATLKFSAASVTEAMTEILAEMKGERAETPAEEPASRKKNPLRKRRKRLPEAAEALRRQAAPRPTARLQRTISAKSRLSLPRRTASWTA